MGCRTAVARRSPRAIRPSTGHWLAPSGCSARLYRAICAETIDTRLGSLPCQKETLARPGDGSHFFLDSWLLGFETDLQRLIADLDAVLNVTGATAVQHGAQSYRRDAVQ